MNNKYTLSIMSVGGVITVAAMVTLGGFGAASWIVCTALTLFSVSTGIFRYLDVTRTKVIDGALEQLIKDMAEVKAVNTDLKNTVGQLDVALSRSKGR